MYNFSFHIFCWFSKLLNSQSNRKVNERVLMLIVSFHEQSEKAITSSLVRLFSKRVQVQSLSQENEFCV